MRGRPRRLLSSEVDAPEAHASWLPEADSTRVRFLSGIEPDLRPYGYPSFDPALLKRMCVKFGPSLLSVAHGRARVYRRLRLGEVWQGKVSWTDREARQQVWEGSLEDLETLLDPAKLPS